MSNEFIIEARRQIEICNACRYCEGYCSVFPAITKKVSFSDGDLTQLANLCHNCRGCYYACQYTDPHEFALNVPKVLAEVRNESWKSHAWPQSFANLFENFGLFISVTLVISISFLFWLATSFRPASGIGFYSIVSHSVMVAVFSPSFVLPLATLVISIRRYWKSINGCKVKIQDIIQAIREISYLKDLSGGHGEGCNYETDDQYSNKRRVFHQATVYGFLLCFLSTCAGTIMHYLFGLEAPYPLFSIPKLLGIPGGLSLCIGTAGLFWLKLNADKNLDDMRVWGGETAFIVLLFVVSATGLVLYFASGSNSVSILLPIHLGSVLTFFLVTPYSKMIHGIYRIIALIQNSALKREEYEKLQRIKSAT